MGRVYDHLYDYLLQSTQRRGHTRANFKSWFLLASEFCPQQLCGRSLYLRKTLRNIQNEVPALEGEERVAEVRCTVLGCWIGRGPGTFPPANTVFPLVWIYIYIYSVYTLYIYIYTYTIYIYIYIHCIYIHICETKAPGLFCRIPFS